MNQRLKERIAQINHLEGWCTPEKGEHLAQIILREKPNVIVEIGVFGGRSAIAMGMACQENGIGTVIGIDPWSSVAALEGGTSPENDEWWAKVNYDVIHRDAVAARFSLGVEDVVEFRKAHDAEQLGEFLDQSIDMLHLDSNHSELVSVRSVRDWTPKLRPGGILVMDDTHWASQARAVELLNTELGYSHHETREFRNDAGQITMQYMVFQKSA